MSKLRSQFVAVMYLVFLVFFVFQKMYIEENLYKIEKYDELLHDYSYLMAEHDCLEKKFGLAEKYMYELTYPTKIDWDKAVELKNK